MSLDTIVIVNIDRLTKLPSRKGFGVPMIIDQNVVQANKVDTFLNPSEMLDLGFSTADEAYKAAVALTSQRPRPEKFKVGRRDANVAQVSLGTIDTVLDNTTYTTTINGTPFAFLSDGDATDLEIRDGLIAAINGGAEPVTAAPGASNTYTLTADVAGDGFSLATDANQTPSTTTPNKGIVEETALIQETDDDFYFVLSTSRTEQDVLALAGHVETLIKLYGVDDDDPDSRDLSPSTDTTSLFAQLKAQNYDRTFTVFSADQDGYAAAAWIGKNAPKDPGSITWKFKGVAGVVADKLTTTQKINISGKNGNTYTEVGGVNIFEEGVVVNGEFIDIIRGTDWIQVRMQEEVYTLLINEDKVPFDNGGIEAVLTQMRKILDQAVTNKILRTTIAGQEAEEATPSVFAPDISDIPAADRAARFLQGLEFSGFYAGAVHKVKIDGTLSI